jgi:hypothetical protein
MLQAPAPVTAEVRIDAPASTNGKDGKATVTAKGGTGKYTYAWDSGETAAKALTLAGGAHNVTVTDENGCSTTATVNMLENILALAVSLDQPATIKCAGGQDAALKAAVNGGKGPFTYAWSNGATTDMLSGIGAGAYTVTVTDATGQSSATTFTVKAPEAMTLEVAVTAPASTNARDGKATVTAKGGTGTYTFKWDNGETVAKAVTLGGGAHTVTVTDQNGCTATASVTMPENILPLVVRVSQTQSIKCAGEATAALKAEISGGKPPYTTAWSGPSTGSGEALANVGPGAYVFTVTDSEGSKSSASIDVASPAPLTVTVQEIVPA